ncbi:MAG TPA: hypothetical protein ENK09_06575 [Nitrospirae bacterium]|nr:hypothetical protein [Nitrospirota bacterium]
MRVGNWRVVYDIDHDKRIITVPRVGHRERFTGEAYQDAKMYLTKKEEEIAKGKTCPISVIQGHFLICLMRSVYKK